MEFQVMMRGKGYIGAAGRGPRYRAADDRMGELTQRIFYFSEPQGILDALFQRAKGIHSAFIRPEDYRSLKDLCVLVDSRQTLMNFGMGNYALFRVRR